MDNKTVHTITSLSAPTPSYESVPSFITQDPFAPFSLWDKIKMVVSHITHIAEFIQERDNPQIYHEQYWVMMKTAKEFQKGLKTYLNAKNTYEKATGLGMMQEAHVTFLPLFLKANQKSAIKAINRIADTEFKEIGFHLPPSPPRPSSRKNKGTIASPFTFFPFLPLIETSLSSTPHNNTSYLNLQEGLKEELIKRTSFYHEDMKALADEMKRDLSTNPTIVTEKMEVLLRRLGKKYKPLKQPELKQTLFRYVLESYNGKKGLNYEIAAAKLFLLFHNERLSKMPENSEERAPTMELKVETETKIDILQEIRKNSCKTPPYKNLVEDACLEIHHHFFPTSETKKIYRVNDFKKDLSFYAHRLQREIKQTYPTTKLSYSDIKIELFYTLYIFLKEEDGIIQEMNNITKRSGPVPEARNEIFRYILRKIGASSPFQP